MSVNPVTKAWSTVGIQSALVIRTQATHKQATRIGRHTWYQHMAAPLHSTRCYQLQQQEGTCCQKPHLLAGLLFSPSWHCLLGLAHRLAEQQQPGQHAAPMRLAGHLVSHCYRGQLHRKCSAVAAACSIKDTSPNGAQQRGHMKPHAGLAEEYSMICVP